MLDLGRRERVQVDRVARLDRAEEVLVVVDAEVRVVAALHQHAGAAELERLLDLLEDRPASAAGSPRARSRGAVEGAEVAGGDADVRVVDVAVDDERRRGRDRCGGAQLVGGAADGDQVARLEQREGVVVGDPLAVERLVEDRGRGLR